MKKQIARLSPHQNGKVVGILSAVMTLIFVVPVFLMFNFFGPPTDQYGQAAQFPPFMLFIFPVLYLILGYIVTAIACALYNVLARFVGGFEFETRAEEA